MTIDPFREGSVGGCNAVQCRRFALATPVLAISPSVQAAAQGAVVTVSVRISGLDTVSPRQFVSNFDLNVFFNAGLLSQNGLALFQAETQLGGAGLAFFDTMGTVAGNAAGNAYSLASEADLEAAQSSGAFTLFTISFTTALINSAAYLDFGANPNFEQLVVGRDGRSMNLQYAGACIAIGDSSCDRGLPEPQSFGLAALALLGAGWFGSTRRRGRGSSATAAA